MVSRSFHLGTRGLDREEVRFIADLSNEEAKTLQMAYAMEAEQLRSLGQAEPQFSVDPCDPPMPPKTKPVCPNPKEVRFLHGRVQ